MSGFSVREHIRNAICYQQYSICNQCCQLISSPSSTGLELFLRVISFEMSLRDGGEHVGRLKVSVEHLFNANMVNARTQSILIRDPILIDCNESISSHGNESIFSVIV